MFELYGLKEFPAKVYPQTFCKSCKSMEKQFKYSIGLTRIILLRRNNSTIPESSE